MISNISRPDFFVSVLPRVCAHSAIPAGGARVNNSRVARTLKGVAQSQYAYQRHPSGAPKPWVIVKITPLALAFLHRNRVSA